MTTLIERLARNAHGEQLATFAKGLPELRDTFTEERYGRLVEQEHVIEYLWNEFILRSVEPREALRTRWARVRTKAEGAKVVNEARVRVKWIIRTGALARKIAAVA